MLHQIKQTQFASACLVLHGRPGRQSITRAGWGFQSTTMKTIIENNKAVGDSAYWGQRGHWFIAAAQHRDSDCLTRSNFRSFKAALAAQPAIAGWSSDDVGGYTVESFNHWAVGWVEYLLINPECKLAVGLAEELRASLEDYPVLDENDFSQLESDEANEVWTNCFSPAERIKYIRDHKSQFEFRDFKDLIGCVRGNYFSGYASELLS